ncbi:MAG: hypothetical protein M3463_20820, partial [Verrucomicrobiota bacterium]|nr:hypothetical protein [Verrucomicrobiota bacterium]
LKGSAPGKRKQALANARAALEKMEPKSKFRPMLEAQIRDAEQKLASQESEDARKEAAAAEADAVTLKAVKWRARTLAQEYKFAEARKTVAAATLASDSGKREKDALSKKLEGLAKFKMLLIQDLNASKYAQPVTRKNGQVMPGEVRRAAQQALEVGNQFGGVQISWSELSTETVLQMATSFMRPDLPADRLADRKWYCGMFAFFAGKDREGRTLMAEAAGAKTAYGDVLPLILEFPGPL